jgi:hypothetical protein
MQDSVSLHREQKYIEKYSHGTPIHRHTKISHRKFFHIHRKSNYIENLISYFLL